MSVVATSNVQVRGLSAEPLETEAGVALQTEAGAIIELESTTWVDLYDDLLDDANLKARYGTFGQRPIDRVANPGSIDFTLDNSPLNSGGAAGYYTPDHGSVRTGFEVGVGARLAIEYDSDTYYKWVGRLNKANPDAGKYSKERTVCRGRDWIGDAAYIKPEHIDVQTTKRADELLTTAVAALDNTPPATSYATGKSTFAYAFDEIRDGQTTMRQILKNIALCELGLINEIGDTDTGGVLTLEHRHERITDTDVLVTLDDTEFDYLIVGEDERLVFNDIKITAHPRVVDTDASLQTLWALQGDAITIPAGQTETILGNYTDSDNPAIRIGGADVITPTSDDYTWSGSDSDLAITTTIGGNSAKFACANSGTASGELSKLQIRGKRVLVYQPAIVEAYDSDSIADHDNRPLNMSLPYQNKTNEAQDFADVILSWQKDALLRLKSIHFTANSSDKLMKAMLRGEPGRRITVAESLSGVSGDYFINGVQLQITKGDLIKTAWYVGSASDVTYFMIDTSLIDGPDILAF